MLVKTVFVPSIDTNAITWTGVGDDRRDRGATAAITGTFHDIPSKSKFGVGERKISCPQAATTVSCH